MKSAGNRDLTYNPDWYVTTPGLGWNVITVGAFDDHGDGEWAGDTMWPDSCYVDPVYNRVKPEVVAPGVGVRTTEPTDYHNEHGEWISSEAHAQAYNFGTSLAAPVVSGEAALLMERDTSGTLRDWAPETVKAVIMASALHDVDETGTDRDGVGGVDCSRADVGVRWGQWFLWNSYYPDGYDDNWHIQHGLVHVSAGCRVRVVICWLSNPPDYDSDSLDTNLSLYVMSPSWTTAGTSASPHDACEVVDFVASEAGAYTICVWRDPSSTESYNTIGGAWAIKCPPATAVVLHSFTATPTDNAIGLAWETANEIDTLGFNVYRAASLDGPLTQLNNSLIPCQSSGSPMGAVYTYLDETVAPGIMTHYWLEAVDVSGTATRHGPVSAVVQSGTGYRIYLPLASK